MQCSAIRMNIELGIYEMQKGDIIEIDNLQELAEIDNSYNKYMED